MRPAIFEFWFRLRAWWFLLTTRRVGGLTPSTEAGFMSKVASYNRSKLWEFHRVRTEKFMVLLRCIDEVPKDAKILCIGPRNEAEVLLLSLYGFPLRNITAIDLFSYSPLITCMDMHALSFPADSFDVVYTAWTMKYSYDLQRACREIVRVVKPGGIVVTGFSHTTTITEEVGSPLRGGLQELLQQFAPHVDWVHWQESTPVLNAEEVSVIFRVRKNGQ